MLKLLDNPEFVLYRRQRRGLIESYGREYAFVANRVPEELATFQRALDSVGVQYTVVERKAFSATCSGEMVLFIWGMAREGHAFFKNGGILSEAEAFKGVRFDKKPGMDEISTPSDDAIKATMQTLRIPFSENNGRITLSGKTALAAVAMGEGRFTGSLEYLGLAGLALRQ